MKRPFAVIGLTLFFITSFLFEHETGVAVTAFAVFTAALVISLFIKQIRTHGFLPVFFASGAVSCVLMICATNFIYLPVMAYNGVENAAVKAYITSTPKANYGKYYCETNVISVNGEDADFKLRMVFNSPPEAELYDAIEGNFNLYALGASDEDLLKSYKSQGVFLGGYPLNQTYNVITVPEDEKPFDKKISDFREKLKLSFFRVLPDEKGALAVALNIGETDLLPDGIYSDFKTVGISHIICVSGFHLSLWSMLALKLFRKLKVSHIISNILAGLCVIGFMLIAGLTYSVVRAGIMMLIFLLGDVIMRRRDSLNSLGLALAFISVSNPFAIGSVSLKLSALATLGIILYNQYIAGDIRKITDKIPFALLRKAAESVTSSLMITVSATAFTLPVSLPLYGTVNFLTFISNLIIVPLAGVGMVMSSITAFLGNVFNDASYIIALPVNKLLGFIIDFAHSLAQIKSTVFYLDKDSIVMIFIGVFIICLSAVFISQVKKRVYTLASLLCVLFFMVSVFFVSYTKSQETRITVIDCDDGMNILVSNNGDNMLIGCSGEDFFGSRKITDAIYSNGNELNTLVLCDSSDDKSGYLFNVLSAHKPDRAFYDSLPRGAELMLSKTQKNTFLSLDDSEKIHSQSCIVSGNYCVLAETEDISALICFGSVFDYSALPQSFKNTDVIISYGNMPRGINELSCSYAVLVSEGDRVNYIGNMLENKGISCVSTNGESKDLVICANDKNISVE